MKKLYKLCISAITFSTLAFLPPRTYQIKPQIVDSISGKDWSYSTIFKIQHKEILRTLIQCESAGVNNVSPDHPDSNGIDSLGILQFQQPTWNDFQRTSGIYGDIKNPEDQLRLADWAVGNGLLDHWSCARIKHLI